MTPLTEAEQLYNQALIYHKAGQWDQAIRLYQQAIAKQSNFFEANLNLAVLLEETGDLNGAIARYRRAAELRPEIPEIHNNLGNALRLAKRHKEALKSLTRALKLNSNYAEAHNNIGIVLLEIGLVPDAIRHYQTAIHLRPRYPNALINLAVALNAVEQVEPARLVLSQYLELEPGNAMAWVEMARIQLKAGQFDQVEHCSQTALSLEPSRYEALVVMADMLVLQNRLDEAITWFERATVANPKRAEGFVGLGNLHQHFERFHQAAQAFEKAILLDPGAVHARNNLGLVYAHMGRLEEGLAVIEEVIELMPTVPLFLSNWLFSIPCLPNLTADNIAAAHRTFGTRFTQPACEPCVAQRSDPDRRLRIGYLSPDFRNHVCAFFIEPLLARHDKNAVEVYLYGEVPHPDDTTKRFQARADHWYSTVGKSDQEVCEQIQRDQVDILVDLAGHTSGNRLLVMARRPAPIQVTWPVGTANTSGLSTVDYILLDRHMAPADQERLFTEKVWPLTGPHLPYRPPEYAPEESPPPAMEKQHITFGCFSRPIRLNDQVIALWARILQAVPGSKILLNARAFLEPETQELMVRRWEQQGIGQDRLEFHVTRDSISTIHAYSRIDVALDPFPQNAGTTNYEALWMGVPVVTLRSRPPSGRITTSLLHHLGLSEWVANDWNAYVRIAADLARDPQRLLELRYSLRGRFQASPVRDEIGFARGIESIYREMWHRYCQQLTN